MQSSRPSTVRKEYACQTKERHTPYMNFEHYYMFTLHSLLSAPAS